MPLFLHLLYTLILALLQRLSYKIYLHNVTYILGEKLSTSPSLYWFN